MDREVVFGDSTPFPYGVEFIELVRAAVTCGTQLLWSQHMIDVALERSAHAFEDCQRDHARLDKMLAQLRMAIDGFRSSTSQLVVNAAGQVIEASRALVEGQRATASEQARTQVASTDATLAEARASACRALETFLARYDLPETGLSLHLRAGPEGYGGQSAVQTPFGVEAVFALDIARGHVWAAPRRLSALCTGVRIHVPEQGGWLSTRTHTHKVRLDALFISELVVGGGRTRVTLRRGPCSGPGYQLELTDGEEHPVTLAKIDDEGRLHGSFTPDEHPEDRAEVERICARIIDSVCDLATCRGSLVTASFDRQPLSEHDRPRDVCARLVQVMAPVVAEISRRSGAPGELVLRRGLGGSRREEVYVTKGELLDLVLPLPAHLRGVFEPFRLDGPRSPRTPVSAAHSVSGEI
ncbi:MAG TPA: hypothetical protein VMZ28_20150 [Kofleriaceae bacterium]|nr:hypothetical protein [Kofleriaceae bacterium]